MPNAEIRHEKARRIVFEYVKAKLEKTDKHVVFRLEDVYIVSFTFVLNFWKAMVVTTLPDGMYYELTYNDAESVTYLDAYKKWDNVEIPDEDNRDPFRNRHHGVHITNSTGTQIGDGNSQTNTWG